MTGILKGKNTKIKREKRADDDPLVELKGGRQK
jgi:hypothetical protein